MTISEQIIQVIDKLCEKVGIAIDWTGDNVIPYVEVLCRKLVTYEIATSVCWILLIGGLFTTSALVLRKIHPWAVEKYDEDCEGGYFVLNVVLWLVTVGLGIASVCVSAVQAMDIIKCLTFPEMYVFEYISALVK